MEIYYFFVNKLSNKVSSVKIFKELFIVIAYIRIRSIRKYSMQIFMLIVCLVINIRALFIKQG